MPVLSEIISAKLSGGGAIAEEDNLEQGQIFVYSPNKYNRGPAGYG